MAGKIIAPDRAIFSPCPYAQEKQKEFIFNDAAHPKKYFVYQEKT